MSNFLFGDLCTDNGEVPYSSMDNTTSPERSRTHFQSDDFLVVSESDDEKPDKVVDAIKPLNFRKRSRSSEEDTRSESTMDDSGSVEESWTEDPKEDKIVIDSESDEEETDNDANVKRTSSFREYASASMKSIHSDSSMLDENSTSVEQSWAAAKGESIVIDSDSDEKGAENIIDISKKASFREHTLRTSEKGIHSDYSMHDEGCASVEQSWADPKSDKIVIDSESDEKEEQSSDRHDSYTSDRAIHSESSMDEDSVSFVKSWVSRKPERIVINSESDEEKPGNVVDIGGRTYSPTNNSANSKKDWSDYKERKIVLGSESDEETVRNHLDFQRSMNTHQEKFHQDARLYNSLVDSRSNKVWTDNKLDQIPVFAENTQIQVETIAKCLATPPVEPQKADNPKGLKTQLMPHQQEALFWLTWRERQKPAGGVLADDMGLGKTLTMISLIMASKEQNDLSDDSDSENRDDSNWSTGYKGRGVKGHTLVICPASLLAQWENEVKNRCKKGVLSTKLYHGSNREKVPRQLGKYDVVITTYNIAGYEFRNMSTLFKIKWQRIILDEAHIIRNHKTQVSQAVCGLSASKRWALTGTPIHNKELDLYSILKFLQCSPFDDLRVWKRWMDDKNSNIGRNRLATVMKSLMLRRTKQELQEKGLLDALPDKVIEEVDVQLDDEEQLVYEKVLIFSRTLFAQFLSQRVEKEQIAALDPTYYSKCKFLGKSVDTQFTKAQNELLSLHADVKTHEILVLLLRLRQICCHPSLIHAMLDQEDIEGSGAIEDEKVDSDLLFRMNSISLLEAHGEESTSEKEIGVDSRVRSNILTSKNPVFERDRLSSKIKAVFRVTRDILKKGDKLVIVSEWATMLDIIASCLETMENASFAKLTGSVAVKDRQAIIDTFNAEDDGLRILLLSLTAGGVGLNLVGANHLLLVDVHWNPQLESQAQDRIYRFGQKKDVFVYKFICKNTIEERIKQLQDRKLDLANSILSGVKNSVKKLSLNDLKSLFSM